MTTHSDSQITPKKELLAHLDLIATRIPGKITGRVEEVMIQIIAEAKSALVAKSDRWCAEHRHHRREQLLYDLLGKDIDHQFQTAVPDTNGQLKLLGLTLPTPQQSTSLDHIRAEAERVKSFALSRGVPDLKTCSLSELERVMDEYHSLSNRPSGEIVRHTCTSRPRKTWSNEAKYRVRRSRLETRLRKQFSIPQLYDHALKQAISDKPWYYGLDPQKIL